MKELDHSKILKSEEKEMRFKALEKFNSDPKE